MADRASNRIATAVARIDKYAGLIALAASVALGAMDRGPVYVYAFAGLTVAFLTFFLVRIIRTTRKLETPERMTRFNKMRRVLAVIGLVAVYCLAGLWTCWISTRPGLKVLMVSINEDVAIERLVADYPLVVDGTISLAEAVIAFREEVQEVRDHVKARLAEVPVALSPVELSILIENVSHSRQIVAGVQVHVYGATWLNDCYGYGPPVNAFVEDVHFRLCPWWQESDLPRQVSSLREMPPSILKKGGEPEVITVLLRNASSSDCVEPATALLATAIYDLDVEVIYGKGRIARYRTRQLIAVPSLRYALDEGETGFESSDTFDENSACHLRNLELAEALFKIEPQRLAGRMVQDYATAYRAIRP